MNLIMIGGSAALKIQSIIKQSADDISATIYPNMRAFLDAASQRSLTFERLLILEDGYSCLGNSAQAVLSQFLSFMSSAYPSLPIIALGKRNQDMTDLSLALSATVSLSMDAAKINSPTIIDMIIQPLELLKTRYADRIIDPTATPESTAETPALQKKAQPEKHSLFGHKNNKNSAKAGTSPVTPLNRQTGAPNSDLGAPSANVNPFAEVQADNINPFASPAGTAPVANPFDNAQQPANPFESQLQQPASNVNPFENQAQQSVSNTQQGTSNVNPFENQAQQSSNPFDNAQQPANPFDNQAQQAETPASNNPFDNPDIPVAPQKKEKHGLFGRKKNKASAPAGAPAVAPAQLPVANVNPFENQAQQSASNVNPFDTQPQQPISPAQTAVNQAPQGTFPAQPPEEQANVNLTPFSTPSSEVQSSGTAVQQPLNSDNSSEDDFDPFAIPMELENTQPTSSNTPAEEEIDPFSTPLASIAQEQPVTGTVSDASAVEEFDPFAIPLAPSPLDNSPSETPIQEFSPLSSGAKNPDTQSFFAGQGTENSGSVETPEEVKNTAENPLFQSYVDEKPAEPAPVTKSSKNQISDLAPASEQTYGRDLKADFDEISPVPFAPVLPEMPSSSQAHPTIKANVNVDDYDFSRAVKNLPKKANRSEPVIEEADSANISNIPYVDDTRYNQQFAPAPRVVEKIVEKEVYVSSNSGTPVEKLLELNQQVVVIITGDRRSGVTYTALNLASLYGRRLSTLLVDLDTDTYGGQLYQDLGYLCSEEENVQNGLTRLRGVNMLQNLVMHDSDAGYDYLFSLIGNQKPSEENYKNIQDVLLAQKYYQLTIIDCPWNKLKYFTELAARSKVLICVEPDISGCHNTIELLNDIPATSRLSQAIERNGAFVSKLGTDVNTLLTNLKWIGDTFDIDVNNGDTPWHTLRVLGTANRENLASVMKKL